MARLPRVPATRVTPALARALREWAGWFVVAAGAVMCVLGWYGISGESVIEQQLPYLASATIPGAALIVAGVVLVSGRPARRTEQADRRIESLYALLVSDAAAEGETPEPPSEEPDDSALLLAVPGGTLYHRRDCPLVADKPGAEPIDATAIGERALVPCPVCDPPTLPPYGDGPPGERPPGDRPASPPAEPGASEPDAPEPGAPEDQGP
jgi:hypothetical protein